MKLVPPSIAMNVLDFGARGDGRTDDSAGINRALRAAAERGGAEVRFPPRLYLVGGTPRLDATALVLEGASNVSLSGAGATILQGPHGLRTLGIFGCDHVRVTGLRFLGSGAHAGQPYYQHSAAIAVNYGSRLVEIEHCRVSNYLGDCIYLGGTLTDGGGTGSEVHRVSVRHCTLKERYGDGRRIYGGGSRSRLAIAVVDASGVEIRGNAIYGGIDFEPNLDGQHTVDCVVEDNRFLEGPVAPQASIGRAYHHDEALVADGAPGAAMIEAGVSFTGIPGTPVVHGNLVRRNRFDRGAISVQNPYVARVADNAFRRGQIVVGARAGANYTTDVRIENNRAEWPLPGESSFIKLAGRVASCEFTGNTLDDAAGAVIGSDGPGSGDLGDSVFRGNVNTGRLGEGKGTVLGFSPAASSVVDPAVDRPPS